MNHDAMRIASELPISGEGGTPTLAASGGLEVPGREVHAPEAPAPDDNHEPIPGEHDHSTEPSTEPGIVATTGFGGDLPATPVDPTVDEETRRQIRWEAGGRIRHTADSVPRPGPDTEAHPGERHPDEPSDR